MATEKQLIDANAIKYREYRSGGGRDYPENIVTEDEIAKLPTVDAVEVVYGQWKAHKPDCRGYAAGFICSNCGGTVYMDYSQKECEYNYCPNCGAKMKEGTDNGK